MSVSDMGPYERGGSQRSSELRLYNNTDLNVRGISGVKRPAAIHGVVHIVLSSHGTPPVSRSLPWPYHRFYLNRLNLDDLLRVRRKRSWEWKAVVDMITKGFWLVIRTVTVRLVFLQQRDFVNVFVHKKKVDFYGSKAL